MARKDVNEQLAFLDDEDHAPPLYRLLQKIPYLRDQERLVRLVLAVPALRSRRGLYWYGGSGLGLVLVVALLVALSTVTREPEYEKPVEEPDEVLRGVEGDRFAEPEEPVRDVHFQRGDDFLSRGEYSRAINEYSKGISTNAALAYHNLGVVYHQLQEFDEAIESFQRAIDARPDLSRSYSALGLTLHEVGRHAEALQYHLGALRLDPDNSALHNNVGNAYVYVGDHHSAQRHYDHAIELNPSNIDAMTNRNVLQLTRGNYEAAIVGFREILAFDPDNYEVKINLGIAYRKQGDYEAAMDHFRRAQQLNRTPNVFINIGDTFRDMNRPEDAINAYDSAVNLTDSTYPLKKLAEYYYVLLRFPELYEKLEEIFAQEPWFPRGEELRAYANYLQGQESRAVTNLKRLLRRNPEDLAALRGYAQLQLLEGDLPEARYAVDTLQEFHSREPIAQALRGEYLRKLRSFQRAEEALQGEHDYSRYFLAKLLMERNRKDEALPLLQQVASSHNTKSGHAHFLLMLESLGRHDAPLAADYLEGALARGIGKAQREYIPRFLISDRYKYRLIYAFSPFNSIEERYLEYTRPFLLETGRTQEMQESAMSSYEQSLYRVAYRQFLRATQHTETARLNNHGVERSLSGDLVRALEYFKRAQEKEPGNALVKYNIALTYQKMGYDREAGQRYEELRNEAPSLYEVDINMAVMDARRGDREAVILSMSGLQSSVINDYRNEYQIDFDEEDDPIKDPRMALIVAIAQTLTQEQPTAGASEIFEELAQLFPDFYEGLLFREIFTGITFDIPPRLQVNPRYLMLKGDRALRAEQPELALRYYRTLYNQEINVLSSTKMGIAYSRMGRHEQGNQYFNEAVEQQPSIAALNNLGNSYADAGNYHGLQQSYERALEQNQDNFYLAMNYAYANQQFRRYNFAREVFEVASGINPSNPMPYYNLAKIHLMFGRHFMAREELFRGMERYPQMPVLNYLMSLIELIDGNFHDSYFYLRRSVNQDLDSTDLQDIRLTYQIH
ncbi:tetratricopeptide repeat protein [Desulfurispira natronophila]|uniref:Tetratricopeptide (TPR) repeat protein n=1 Tax=Desulfurispira natronophila TaxID=682562 RepID=A0A7W8DGJ1_9BACT|nr:tetratricopeptide repeat protein [Desulfurispira natronophila]MBB5021556.1 tetratricopeptide (TPR) repeat protein [Desulfurispira natronophila]